MLRRRELRGLAVSLFMLGALVAGMLGSRSVAAQVVGATLSGTITDAQGAAIPNAKVSIKNTSTGVTRDVTTNETGAYNAPNLLPGTYEVTVTASGFTTHVQSGLELTVGAQQSLNVPMAVGEMTQKVEVTGEEAVSVELTSSAIGAVVNSETVRELPLNGRNWTDLTALQPGVGVVQSQPSYTSGGDRGNRGFGQQMTISGMRPVQNNYRLDGISLNTYDNAGPGSAIGGNLGVDAIQEFSVLTTNYSAEYGKTSGGVVNAISRSGTNSFHGNAYEFLRNSVFDARNFFDYYSLAPGNSNKRIAPFRRNQFGGSAGGPIHKGTTFIFGDYEGLRSFKGIPVSATTFSQDTRNGVFNDAAVPSAVQLANWPGAPACTAMNATQCKVTVSPAAAAYFTFFPLPNVGTLTNNGTTGTYNFSGTNIVGENFFTIRADQKFSEKDSLFGTYKYDKTTFTDPDGFDTILNGLLTFNQVYSVEETHLFSSSVVNTARFGYNRNNAQNNIGNTAINPSAANSALATVPGFNAAEAFIGNVTQYRGGLNVDTNTTFVWNSFQGYDDAFVTHGNHSLKFGVAVERMQLNMLGGEVGGRWTFDSPFTFIANIPTSYTSTIDVIRSHGYRQSIYGVYAQDDWRFRPNLTLNLGIRYEMSTTPSQVNNQMVHLPTITSAAPILGDPAFANPTLHNFEPRVGFAWDPFKDGKTSVRAGFGMFDVLPLAYQYYVNQTNSSPFTLRNAINNRCQVTPAITTNCVGVGSFYNNLPNVAISGSSFYFEPNPKRNYTMQWNLALQRAITPTWTATAGYIGSRGVHMSYPLNTLDSKQPILTPAGYLWPGVVTPNNVATNTKPAANPVPNSNFSSIATDVWGRDSYYEALELGLTKKMSRGLQAQASFTWGRSSDDGSAAVLTDQYQNAIGQDAIDPHRYLGLSDYDIKRTLVLNLLYEVPRFGSLTGFMGGLANGWQLSTVFKVADGVPFTPTVGGGSDALGATGTPFDLPNRLTNGPGCNTAVNVGNVASYINGSCFTLAQAPDVAFYNANCNSAVGNGDPNKGPINLSCLNLLGNAGRNSLIGPGQENLDFSVVKNTHIGHLPESTNLQFRAEFFNIMNRANFATIVSGESGAGDVFSATGNVVTNPGKLVSTTTDSREIQFALKFIW